LCFLDENRERIIPARMKQKLWAYIGGIARTNDFKALAVGGMLDHVHALLFLPATLAVAKAVQVIKGGSSKWLNDHLPRRFFAWRDSYGCLHHRHFAGKGHDSLHQQPRTTSRHEPGKWQRVRIEFEYASRNSRNHGHRPRDCDMIVCWVHDWADCPKELDVVELKRLVHDL
jgi:REP element-mobilizing transposase RayT